MFEREELEMLEPEAIRDLAQEELGKAIDGRIKDKGKIIDAFLSLQAGGDGGQAQEEAEQSGEQPSGNGDGGDSGQGDGELDTSKFVRGDDIVNKSERVWVQFSDGPGTDGHLPIQVAINGHAQNIPRNVPVHIAKAVLAVLNDAVQLIERSVDDGNGGFRTEVREVARFPYQLVDAPRDTA